MPGDMDLQKPVSGTRVPRSSRQNLRVWLKDGEYGVR
jgi:hypothetical protein